MNRCSGSQITRDASTSSAVTGVRNMACSFATPFARFFTTTSARCPLVRPASARSRWARRAK